MSSPTAIPGLSREAAVENLAARLYENMDRLDPGLAPLRAWAEMAVSERGHYIELVEDLLAFEDWVRIGSQ